VGGLVAWTRNTRIYIESENLKERNNFGDLDVNDRII
jgi:hypothetical protein